MSENLKRDANILDELFGWFSITPLVRERIERVNMEEESSQA